jgi:hypothetical protein
VLQTGQCSFNVTFRRCDTFNRRRRANNKLDSQRFLTPGKKMAVDTQKKEKQTEGLYISKEILFSVIGFCAFSAHGKRA